MPWGESTTNQAACRAARALLTVLGSIQSRLVGTLRLRPLPRGAHGAMRDRGQGGSKMLRHPFFFQGILSHQVFEAEPY